MLRDGGSLVSSATAGTPEPNATPQGTQIVAVIEPNGAAADGATPTPPLAQATSTGTPIPPSSTPAPEPTSAPPPPTSPPAGPVEYEVKPGDTCGGIARDFGIGLDEFIQYNKLDDNCFIKAGDKVQIPPATPTPGPSPTLPPGVTPEATAQPEATSTLPPQIVYEVRAGDTCSDIAQRFRMSLDQLVQQNNLDANCFLRAGQVLTLTFATPAPVATPTQIVAQTATPSAGYNAPQLVLPLAGAQISDTQATVTLEWLSVGLLRENEWYVVQVQPSGAITVPIFETKATSVKLTRDALGDEVEREFAWWVQVRQFIATDPKTGARIYNDLSTPSAVRKFTWRRPLPPAPTAASDR
jgi:LysM repeat protein